MYARLIQEDPTMAAFYPLEPINSLVQVTGQVKART
jgi:hypothetical protein